MSKVDDEYGSITVLCACDLYGNVFLLG